MGRIFLLDGYNVILQCPTLGGLARNDLESSRARLIELMVHFCAVSDDFVTIVFDGRHPFSLGHETSQPSPRVHVIFSKGGSSADMVLSRLVYKLRSQPDEIVVVSADREVRELCATLGALILSPGTFLGVLRDRQNRVSRTCLETEEPRKTKYAMEEVLSQTSINRLQSIRRKLEHNS